MGYLNVYIPGADGCPPIGAGAAVVSLHSLEADKVIVDYSNPAELGSKQGYADLVMAAAARHRTRIPSLTRAQVSTDRLVKVGYFDEAAGTVTLTKPEELEKWRPGSSGQLDASAGSIAKGSASVARWSDYNKGT